MHPTTVKPVPEGYHTVTPYLIVSGVRELIAFLQRVFDAKIVHLMEGPGGSVMHADVRVGDSSIMMGEASAQWPAMPSSLYVYVPDCDVIYQRALEAGATSIMPPQTFFYGDRHGGVRDASGNQWWIATHVEDVSPEELKRRHEEYAKKQAAGGGECG